jgi:hypothetical protein
LPSTPTTPTPSAGGGVSSQGRGANTTESAFTSSADAGRIKSQGKEQQGEGASGKCLADDRFEWLRHGPQSAAREMDFGARPGVGADPEDTKNVFRPGSCYLSSL